MKIIAKAAILFLIGLMVLSCQKQSGKITNAKDYNQYLIISENKTIENTNQDIIFWQKKYEKSPNQISYLDMLASSYSKLFEITGNTDNLKEAEKFLNESNIGYKYSSVLTLRALAWNYIIQHKFKEALNLANKAKVIGEGIKETEKLLFDVQMELGNYKEAKKSLDSLSNQTDFDYLIRLAKWNNHLGDLKTAITLLEKAKVKAETSNNNYIKIWTYSNLAYWNGHSGNIQESYDYFLKILALDANNNYALKGIAWIVFSHDGNAKEAKRIIDSVSEKDNSTDFRLLKAQIDEYGNHGKKLDKRFNYFKNMLQSNYNGTAATKLFFLPERN